MTKNIIITGASRGIGFELAHKFAQAGHRVLAVSRNKQPVSNLDMDNLEAFQYDLCKEEDHDRLAAHVADNYGRIDALIHNAGYLLNKPFTDTSLEQMRYVYEVNVFGPAALTKALLPYMDTTAHVVAISSMGGVQGSAKFPGLSSYSSSKGAIITLMELLAEEFKESGPKCNTLALGAVQTEMLAEAFPGYEAPLTAAAMADYIFDFALNGHKYFNGKILPVSSSTP